MGGWWWPRKVSRVGLSSIVGQRQRGDRILLSMSVVDGPVVVVAMMGDMGIT